MLMYPFRTLVKDEGGLTHLRPLMAKHERPDPRPPPVPQAPGEWTSLRRIHE